LEALIDDVENAAREAKLFEGVDRLLVGLSAGGDSTALLDILVRLAPSFDLRLAVAHLHHGWRGAEADADHEKARSSAEALGLPFFSDKVDLRTATGSREEAARNARLGFFERLCVDWPADAVALGHTADDQLETIILNLARGAGTRGLAGMRRRGRVGGVLILRPLLDCNRAGLRAYARQRGLDWNEDSSNQDVSLSRNRLRRRLLGDLQQINPGAVGNVARAATLLREEDDWLEDLAAQAFDGLRSDDEYPGGTMLDATGLAALPRPLARRVVRGALREVRGHQRDISQEHVEWVLAAVTEGSDASRDLPGVRVRMERRQLRLLPLTGRRLAAPARAD